MFYWLVPLHIIYPSSLAIGSPGRPPFPHRCGLHERLRRKTVACCLKLKCWGIHSYKLTPWCARQDQARQLFEIFTQTRPQGQNCRSKSIQHNQCNTHCREYLRLQDTIFIPGVLILTFCKKNYTFQC